MWGCTNENLRNQSYSEHSCQPLNIKLFAFSQHEIAFTRVRYFYVSYIITPFKQVSKNAEYYKMVSIYCILQRKTSIFFLQFLRLTFFYFFSLIYDKYCIYKQRGLIYVKNKSIFTKFYISDRVYFKVHWKDFYILIFNKAFFFIWIRNKKFYKIGQYNINVGSNYCWCYYERL